MTDITHSIVDLTPSPSPKNLERGDGRFLSLLSVGWRGDLEVR
jgi:hypothetical protein